MPVLRQWADRRHLRLIQRTGAVVLIAPGITLATGLWAQVMAAVQAWVSGFSVAL